MKIILSLLVVSSLLSCSMIKQMGSSKVDKAKTTAMDASKRAASDALLQKGEAMLQNGTDLSQAIDLFQEAVNLDPTNGGGYYLLALATFKQGDYEKSKGFLQKAETLVQENSPWKEKMEQLKQDLGGAAASVAQ